MCGAFGGEERDGRKKLPNIGENAFFRLRNKGRCRPQRTYTYEISKMWVIQSQGYFPINLVWLWAVFTNSNCKSSKNPNFKPLSLVDVPVWVQPEEVEEQDDPGNLKKHVLLKDPTSMGKNPLGFHLSSLSSALRSEDGSEAFWKKDSTLKKAKLWIVFLQKKLKCFLTCQTPRCPAWRDPSRLKSPPRKVYIFKKIFEECVLDM